MHNRCVPRDRLVECTISFRELRLGERCDPVWKERHPQAEGEIQCGVYKREAFLYGEMLYGVHTELPSRVTFDAR